MIPTQETTCTMCKGLKGHMRKPWLQFPRGGVEFGGAYVPPGDYGFGNVDRFHLCYYCKGAGEFPALTLEDAAEIGQLITVQRGRTKGRLRASWAWSAPKTLLHKRAYFVWRLARFHGGVDVCLPMTAEDECRGDPAKPHLDHMARVAAQTFLGKSTVGIDRWRPLLA